MKQPRNDNIEIISKPNISIMTFAKPIWELPDATYRLTTNPVWVYLTQNSFKMSSITHSYQVPDTLILTYPQWFSFSFHFFTSNVIKSIPTFTTLSIWRTFQPDTHGIYMRWNTTKFEIFGFAKHKQQERGLDSHSPNAPMFFLFLLVHWDASDQKFSRKDGKAANQLM